MKRIENLLPAFLGLAAALLLSLGAGCAAKKVSYQVPPGEEAVEIEASSFDFKPNVIHARTGETLLLRVRNVAGMEHNLTVLDPDGEKLLDADLPAGETTEIRLPLTRQGTYPFDCDKPFHATFGMKGRIVANGE